MTDLSHLLLGDTNIARFARKRDAATFAKACGWRMKDVFSAFNHFCVFWVIGQQVGDDIRLLLRDGTVADFPMRQKAR